MALSSLDKAHCGTFYPLTTPIDKGFHAQTCQYPWGVLTRTRFLRGGMYPSRGVQDDACRNACRIHRDARGAAQNRHSRARRIDPQALAPDLEPHIASGMLAYGHYHYKSKTTGRASGSTSAWPATSATSRSTSWPPTRKTVFTSLRRSRIGFRRQISDVRAFASRDSRTWIPEKLTELIRGAKRDPIAISR